MKHEHHPLEGRRIDSVLDRLAIGMAEDCARFSLRIDAEGLAVAGKAFGCELPSAIGAMRASGGRFAICLGPDEWQLFAPSSEAEGIDQRFAALYAGLPHSLVDVGHRDVGIEISGEAAALALASACALDLEAMPSGTATRTIFDKAQIVLIRHDEQHFRIEVWRSFASHVWAILEAASREVSLGM
jgi:sarcosine oxidase subunit gamma